MRPALVIDSLEPGGAENVVRRLAPALAARGHRPVIYCLKQAGTALEPLFAAGVGVRAFGSTGREWGLPLRLARSLWRDRVDVVVAHSSAALCLAWPAARLTGRPIVQVRHGWLSAGESWYSRLAQRLSPAVTRTVIVAAALRGRLRPARVARQAVHIPDGLDVVPIARGEARARLAALCGRQLPGPVIMSVGNLKPAKDPLNLVAAFGRVREQYPTAQLVWVGALADQGLLTRVRAAVEEHGLGGCVHLVGGVAGADQLLPAADVFCLPSATEATPNALLEAMAHGVPCVATAVGDVGRVAGAATAADIVVQGETGLLVAPRDAGALAVALEQTLADPAAARQRAERARQRQRDRYSLAAMTRAYEQLYAEVMGKGKRGQVRAAPVATQPGVVVLGPSRDAVGGIVTAIDLQLGSDLRRGYRLARWSPRPAMVGGGGPSRGWLERVRRHFGDLVGLARVLRSAEVELLHIHTCSYFSFFRNGVDLLLAKLLRKRVVLHVHGARFGEFCRTAGALRRRLIQRTCEAADAVAVLSPQWLAQLQPFCGGARLVVLPNAYDPGLEVAEVPAARDGGPVRFLHLGALNDRKGIGELIEAARRLDQDGVDFVLRLVGPATAADLARYRARVAAFGLEARVRFEGVVSGEAKRACLGDADVFVLASHHEGVPIALLEAAAAGLPLIATPAGATVAALTPSLEADGTPTRTPVAPIVPIGNPVKLAEVMARLAAEPGLRTRIARAAHHHVTTQYSSARFAQRLDLLYCSVLGRRVGAGSPGMRARFEVDDPAATWQADERGEALRPASPMPTEARRPAQPATSA